MKTKTFPSVVVARMAAAEQLSYYRHMMAPAKTASESTRMKPSKSQKSTKVEERATSK